MYRILDKKVLADGVKTVEIRAPDVARKALPGQFVIVRVAETGERIPLTIQEANISRGSVKVTFLEIGKTTKLLGSLSVGDSIANLAGPLGRPSEIKLYGTVVIAGGGVGSACCLPVARALKEVGNYLISIIGFRSKDLVIMEEEFSATSDEVYVTTDDGSYGYKGFVSNKLLDLLEGGRRIDYVYAVGPAVMMRSVAETTRPFGVKTVVSLNPIMVDGTGMCGACRVEVDGQTKFACVDGPEFDGHKVNFDLLMKRQRFYVEEEKVALGTLER